MIFLYTHYTVVFWLLIGSNQAEQIVIKHVSEDVEAYSVASCTGRCLQNHYSQQNSSHSLTQQNQDEPDRNKPQHVMDSMSEFFDRTEDRHGFDFKERRSTSQKVEKQFLILKNCSEACRDDGYSRSSAAVAKMKQIQENFILKLVCRDEKSLSFRISLPEKRARTWTLTSPLSSSKSTPPTMPTMVTKATSATITKDSNFSTSTSTASTSSSTASESISIIHHQHLNMKTNSSDEVEMKTRNANNSGNELTASSSSETSPPHSTTKHSTEEFVENNMMFVIKLHVAKEPKEYSIYLADDKFFTITGLEHNTTYAITAIAVHTSNEYSVIAKRQPYTTLRRGYTPNMVKEVLVNSYKIDKYHNKLLWANIEWRPSADMNCDYDMICFSPESDEYDAIPVEIRDPRELYTYSIPNITFSSEYKIGIRAKNRNSGKESELYWHTFRAPPCEEWYNYNYNICAPLKPKGLSIEQTFLTEDTLSLNITWSKPEHHPAYYVVRVMDLTTMGNTHIYNLTEESTMLFIPSITIYGILFEVHLTAYTLGGSSSTYATIPTQKQMVMFLPDNSYALRLIFVILAPIICLAIITLTSYVIFNHRRAKLKRYQERCKYFEDLEKKAPTDPKTFDFPTKTLSPICENDTLLQFQRELEEKLLQNDEMEIDRGDLVLHEVLGEGAFGLVRRGIYTPNKANSKEVAVKMLKDQPSLDEIRAFRHEIEVMKSVEKHPNIVSLIGHCTRNHGEMMLLTEYCSVGNLQSFLRDEWAFLNELKKQQNLKKNSNTKLFFRMNYMRTSGPPGSSDPAISSAGDFQITKKNNLKCLTGNDEMMNAKEQSFESGYDKANDINCGTITTYVLTSSADSQMDDITSTNLSFARDDLQFGIIGRNAAENKSYGYDEICTSACKCQVDIIMDIDHHQANNNKNLNNNNSKEIDHLEKIFKTKSNQNALQTIQSPSSIVSLTGGEEENFERRRSIHDDGQHGELELEMGMEKFQKIKKKTILIRNCECQRQQQKERFQNKQQNQQQQQQDDEQEEEEDSDQDKEEQEATITETNNNNNNNKEFIGKAVENKAYFNQTNHVRDQQIETMKKQKQKQKQKPSSNQGQNHSQLQALASSASASASQSPTTPPSSDFKSKEKNNKMNKQIRSKEQVQNQKQNQTQKQKDNQSKQHHQRQLLEHEKVNGKQSEIDSASGNHDNSLSALAERQPLSAADLLDIAKQVAMGMEYLGKNKVVHRDLAARNVLITSDRTVKIADFGLSRDIYQENIYKKTGNGKLPIKWLALESMTHQVYTTQSDVWSYGILLYEIVSLGGLPYPAIPANRLLHLLKSGYRMERPENCGEELYKMMLSCWNATPSERPTFTEIISVIEQLNEKSEEQINYDNLLGVRKIPLQPKKIPETPTTNDDYLQPV